MRWCERESQITDLAKGGASVIDPIGRMVSIQLKVKIPTMKQSVAGQHRAASVKQLRRLRTLIDSVSANTEAMPPASFRTSDKWVVSDESVIRVRASLA